MHDNSRASDNDILPDQKASNAACFQIRAVGWFEGHGVRLDQVLTHNGGCCPFHMFNAACQYLGARPQKPRPYTHRTNHKAGRFIQRSLKQWACSQVFEPSAEGEKYLQPWLGQRSLKEWADCQAYESAAEREKHLQPWLGQRSLKERADCQAYEPSAERERHLQPRLGQRSLKQWADCQAYEPSAEKEKYLQPWLGQRSLKQWACSQVFESSAEREKHLQPRLYRYNRRKEAAHPLNMKPPLLKLLNCEQRPC